MIYITNLDNITGLAEASGSTFCLNIDASPKTVESFVKGEIDAQGFVDELAAADQ